MVLGKPGSADRLDVEVAGWMTLAEEGHDEERGTIAEVSVAVKKEKTSDKAKLHIYLHMHFAVLCSGGQGFHCPTLPLHQKYQNQDL